MRFLSFMSNAPDEPGIEGLIDECGLRPAYNRIFNDEERAYIEERQGSFPLTRGEYIASHLGEFDMVGDLIQFSDQFCNSVQELYIAMRFHILSASFLEVAGDWYAYHQVMQQFIPRCFDLRSKVPQCDKLTQEACEQHVRHTQQIRDILAKDGPLGTHAGYWHICLLMDQRSKLDSALHYARQGKAQGWSGDWDSRIKDLERRLPPKSAADGLVNTEPLGSGSSLAASTILSEKLGPGAPPAQPAQPAPPAMGRVVSCGKCGQKMRIPAAFSKPQGSCIKCGSVVILNA